MEFDTALYDFFEKHKSFTEQRIEHIACLRSWNCVVPDVALSRSPSLKQELSSPPSPSLPQN